MTDKVKEALSAIMDGEAGDLETRRLLDEIARDDALRDTWDRFHLARGVLAGDPVTAMDSAEAIRSLWGAVDSGTGEESVEVVEPLTRTRRRPFGLRTGAAVLGVAAAAVQAVLLYPVQESGGGLSSADSVAQAGSSETLPAEYATQDGLSPETPSAEYAAQEELSPEDRARAQTYLLQHLRRHSMANRAHPIPIAKLATYRPQSQPDRNEQ